MKILLFGTGDYYNKYKNWFRPDDILCLVDNDESKQGTQIDGHEVCLPGTAAKKNFDSVVILSVHEAEMRRQLVELGVSNDRIYKFSDLYKHPEMTVEERMLCFWGDDKSFSTIISSGDPKTILLMSHNLDLNGASLALFYLAKILKKNGYFLLFASWSDGGLRKYLCEEKIPVIVDPNLQIKTQKETAWVQRFHRIICNTLNYYQFLSDRNPKDRIIWWLHDHVMFYESLDRELLDKIQGDNLTVYAAGPIAGKAFRKYFPDFPVKQLIYGIPDVQTAKVPHEKLVFIMIGNVQEYKGQDILIKALCLLEKEIRGQIHVKIVGFRPSAYANHVKRMSEELGDLVSLIPHSDREAIHELLNEADVLVCPSKIDTMSIVTNEGMQHGMPCIVSDAAGVSAYITDGRDGFIVKQGNERALAEKMIWCVDHKEELEQIGKGARSLYEKHFSMEVFEKNLLEAVYEAL